MKCKMQPILFNKKVGRTNIQKLFWFVPNLAESSFPNIIRCVFKARLLEDWSILKCAKHITDGWVRIQHMSSNCWHVFASLFEKCKLVHMFVGVLGKFVIWTWKMYVYLLTCLTIGHLNVKKCMVALTPVREISTLITESVIARHHRLRHYIIICNVANIQFMWGKFQHWLHSGR